MKENPEKYAQKQMKKREGGGKERYVQSVLYRIIIKLCRYICVVVRR